MSAQTSLGDIEFSNLNAGAKKKKKMKEMEGQYRGWGLNFLIKNLLNLNFYFIYFFNFYLFLNKNLIKLFLKRVLMGLYEIMYVKLLRIVMCYRI